MAEVININETQEKRKERKMDEMGFTPFDKVSCRSLKMEPENYKKLIMKILKHADSLDW